jgi:endonuclease-3
MLPIRYFGAPAASIRGDYGLICSRFVLILKNAKALDFGAAAEPTHMHDVLTAVFGRLQSFERQDPISQLIKSLISSHTPDEVSEAVYRRLASRYPDWSELAAAPSNEIEAAIADVTQAQAKARQLSRALRRIAASHPDFRLDFLGHLPVEQAVRWLERLPGVGRKVAAETLNFSTLNRPAFVIDTHVLRVLRRLGFVGPKADIRRAYYAVMAAAEYWSAKELAELHVAMKRLGQTVCRAGEPRCERCPISEHCKTAVVARRFNQRMAA